MGLIKSLLDGFMNPEKAFENIENVMRQAYDIICRNWPHLDGVNNLEDRKALLILTLETRYKGWSHSQIVLFLNDRTLQPLSISTLSKKVIKNEKRELIGWNKKGMTIEGEFILKKNILYNIEEKNMTLKEATKLSAKAFNDLCYMHTPEQVKELMGMMPEVFDLTLPEGILWLAINQDIFS